MATQLQKQVQFKSIGKHNMSPKPVAVALPVEVDEWVRSLPNRSEWLRQVITDAYQREQSSIQDAQ